MLNQADENELSRVITEMHVYGEELVNLNPDSKDYGKKLKQLQEDLENATIRFIALKQKQLDDTINE